jgi:multiple sugar transport system permease protein
MSRSPDHGGAEPDGARPVAGASLLLSRSAREARRLVRQQRLPGMAGPPQRRSTRMLLHGVLLVIVLWSTTPFIWALQTSIKFTRDAVTRVPVLWGYEPTAGAYRAFWLRSGDQQFRPIVLLALGAALVATVLVRWGRSRAVSWPWYAAAIAVLVIALNAVPRLFSMTRNYDYLINSILVTTLVLAISISLGLLAGYGLARYSGVSGATILIVALAFRALPRTAYALPYFVAADRLGVLNSRLVVVVALVALNQPFTIWMLRSFFMEVPRAIEEAAMVDGANRFQAFWRVIVPIMWPGIIATSLFTLLLAYNEFLLVRVLTVTEWTLPVALIALTGGESTTTVTQAAAASVSITLPIVVIIIIFQKHLVKGLAAGAVKG